MAQHHHELAHAMRRLEVAPPPCADPSGNKITAMAMASGGIDYYAARFGGRPLEDETVEVTGISSEKKIRRLMAVAKATAKLTVISAATKSQQPRQPPQPQEQEQEQEQPAGGQQGQEQGQDRGWESGHFPATDGGAAEVECHPVTGRLETACALVNGHTTTTTSSTATSSSTTTSTASALASTLIQSRGGLGLGVGGVSSSSGNILAYSELIPATNLVKC
jgi:hypothetical protein